MCSQGVKERRNVDLLKTKQNKKKTTYTLFQEASHCPLTVSDESSICSPATGVRDGGEKNVGCETVTYDTLSSSGKYSDLFGGRVSRPLLSPDSYVHSREGTSEREKP